MTVCLRVYKYMEIPVSLYWPMAKYWWVVIAVSTLTKAVNALEFHLQHCAASCGGGQYQIIAGVFLWKNQFFRLLPLSQSMWTRGFSVSNLYVIIRPTTICSFVLWWEKCLIFFALGETVSKPLWSYIMIYFLVTFLINLITKIIVKKC